MQIGSCHNLNNLKIDNELNDCIEKLDNSFEIGQPDLKN